MELLVTGATETSLTGPGHREPLYKSSNNLETNSEVVGLGHLARDDTTHPLNVVTWVHASCNEQVVG